MNPLTFALSLSHFTNLAEFLLCIWLGAWCGDGTTARRLLFSALLVSESERQASPPGIPSLMEEQRQEPRAVRPGLFAFYLPCSRVGCVGTGFQQRRRGNASRGNDVHEGTGPCIGERCVVGRQGWGRVREMWLGCQVGLGGK